eukprot:8683920-Pyramimonas_sp.AAC.1
MTSFYRSSCANNGKDALNTPSFPSPLLTLYTLVYPPADFYEEELLQREAPVGGGAESVAHSGVRMAQGVGPRGPPLPQSDERAAGHVGERVLHHLPHPHRRPGIQEYASPHSSLPSSDWSAL